MSEKTKTKPQPSEEAVKVTKKESKVDNRSDFAKKKMTASQFSNIIGLNTRAKFWVSMKYHKNDIRTAKQWSNEMLKEGAIDKESDLLRK